jgi:hypothetical protein
MKRRAILIDAGNANPNNALEGTAADVGSWEEYLMSETGGVWFKSEIILLTNPSIDEVKSAIAKADVGYGFVGYAGHGFSRVHSSPYRFVENFVCLKNGDLSENYITPNAERATVVLDSCRGVEQATYPFRAVEAASMNYQQSRHRQAFEEQLGSTETGTIRLYACQLNAVAGEDKYGGYFTQSLIASGNSISKVGIMTIREAFDSAKVTVQRRDPKQVPEINGGRRSRYFPFAVKL